MVGSHECEENTVKEDNSQTMNDIWMYNKPGPLICLSKLHTDERFWESSLFALLDIQFSSIISTNIEDFLKRELCLW